MEKQFILKSYVKAGAPEEILYMTHPHLGSDNLVSIVRNLRDDYLAIGGRIVFDEKIASMEVVDNKVASVFSASREYPGDNFVFATGHSAYDTYRMLMKHGGRFRTKNFAIGSRVEHSQILINKAQWGVEQLPGVKAAEYRLTSRNGELPVYTFCMCPGER